MRAVVSLKFASLGSGRALAVALRALIYQYLDIDIKFDRSS